MSAIQKVLPMVYAFAEMPAKRDAGEVQPGQRKGVRALRLVQASAAAGQGDQGFPGGPTHHEMAAMNGARSAPVGLPVKAKPEPELAFYRKYTEGMLRRYQTMSMESGRVPSMLGRELFRGKVSSYKVSGFDDVVIFVHDMATCVKKLTAGQQHLIRRIAMQEYTQGETAAMLGLSLRSVVRRYCDAVDELTAMLLAKGMLQVEMGGDRK